MDCMVSLGGDPAPGWPEDPRGEHPQGPRHPAPSLERSCGYLIHSKRDFHRPGISLDTQLGTIP